MKCPHCGKEFNAGKLMGAARSEKKAAASRQNGAKIADLVALAKGRVSTASSLQPRNDREPLFKPSGSIV